MEINEKILKEKRDNLVKMKNQMEVVILKLSGQIELLEEQIIFIKKELVVTEVK